MPQEIELTHGKRTLVDDDIYYFLKEYKWYASMRKHGLCYAVGFVDGKRAYMHRLIMNAPPRMQVDHINHNGLDNRRENLRLCTRQQNYHNSLPRNKTSKYKGVHYYNERNRKKRWVVFIQHKYVGRYATELEAARAFDKAAKDLYGDFAYLNFGNTGCPFCDALPDGEICLDCQIEQADVDVCRAMEHLEELQKQKRREHELRNCAECQESKGCEPISNATGNVRNHQ